MLSGPHFCPHIKPYGQHEDTFFCFIDFKTVFNCVDSDFLWEKLVGLSSNFKSAVEDVCCVNVHTRTG